MSIKKSLRILLIISSMIPVILVSVIAHGLLTDRLMEINAQSLERTARTSSHGLAAKLQTQQTEVSLLAIQEELVSAVLTSNSGHAYSNWTVNSILQKRRETYDHCECISLYNMNNEVIASSDSELIGKTTDSELTLSYILATGSTATAIDGMHPISKNGSTIYCIEIGAPITDPISGYVCGYVISTMNIAYFRTYLNSLTIGETGFCMLLDKDGKVIYHPDPSYVGTNIRSEKLSSLVTNYNKGLMPISSSFEYYFDHTNQLYGYTILPDLNWVLMLKQDTSEIKSVTTIMLTLLVLICTILMIIVIIFANILAKRYSAPIISLRDAMRKASDGNLTVQSNIKSNNELGELSKNFNKMLHIIKTNYEDLESMHEELLSNEEQLRSNYDHIEFLAYHDTLTNLPNKLAFLDYINAVLSSPQSNKRHSVYFVDLDNFKTVNDTLGHEYGDALLVKTAQLLSALIGGNGMLARAGGDEFLIFREDIGTADNAVEFASQIIETFKNPLDLDGEIVYVSMSIGISIYPENGISSKVLIKNSDIAMYKSKDTGKNKFTLFDSTMEEELNRNTLVLEVLRNAIENNDIYIQYQPLMELDSNNIIGYEALMRIRNERLGPISPKEFIPLAEESGLITELSTWLIREACYFNKQLLELGSRPRPVSVNISSVQINRPGFVCILSDILEETGLPPEYLELEITESTLVSSIMDATMLLNNLQELGVKVSLDDFGTGYSSLNYLTQMPIDTLKIDKSFIDNICINEKDVQIAETIIQLAHSLSIKVVAEGVETEEQLSLLKARHCDIVQGYIFSRPLYPAELLEALKEDDLISQCSLF
jgi:diguanylate cyclase (GGDEF)-like protein